MRNLLFVALAGLTALVGCGGSNPGPATPVKNPAVKALFTTQPQAATAGESLAAFQVVFQDKDGKTVEESGGAPVALTLVAGPQGATLGGTTQATLEKGIASFTGVTFTQAGEGYIIEAQRKGISVRSTPFAIRHAAAARLAVTAQTVDVEAGGVFPAFQVSVRDAFGNAVVTGPAGEVTAALVGTSTALGGTTTVALNQGVATFSELMVDVAGEYALAFSVGGLTSVTTAVRVGHGPAKSLAFTTQPSGVAAGAAMAAVAVTLYDNKGNITTKGNGEVTLVLANNPGGATLGGTLTAPVVNGVATFSGLTLDKVGAGYTLQASYGKLEAVTSSAFNVTHGAPAKLVLGGQPATRAAGVALPSVAVSIQDAFGNLATSSTARITVALGNNPGSATLQGTTSVDAVAGAASFSGLSLEKVGAGYTLAFSADGLTGATSEAFDITPGPAASLAFTGQPVDGTAGQTLGAVAVSVRDAFGNLATGSTASIRLALGNAPASATLGGTATVNAVAGVATFNTLSITVAGSGYTLRASSGSLTVDTSSAFSIAPAAAAKLAFEVDASDVVAGEAMAPALKVRILDAFDNLTSSTASVTLELASAPAGATLSGGDAVDAVAGVATFANVRLNKAGRDYILGASSGSLVAATTGAFDVSPAAAAKLVFGQQPSDVVAGEAIAPAVTVSILDRFDNATSATDSVTVSLAGNGTLSGTLTAEAVAGVATFANLSVDKVGEGNTLGAASGSLTAATSTAFAVTPAAPSKLVFEQQPSNVVAGEAIAPAVSVRILDRFDNATSATSSVTVSLVGSGTLSGTAQVDAVNGVATFANLSVDKAGEGYTLNAASGSLTAATSATFAVTPAAPSKLVFGQQPSNVVAGEAIAPAVTVRILDQFDNATSATNLVTVSLVGSGTLSGTAQVEAVNGVATFANLSVDKAGQGYTLRAGSGFLIEATSATFAVTPAAPSKLVFGTQPSNVVAGVAIAPAVTVRILDQFDNATSATNLVTVSLQGSGTLSGTAQVNAVNGVATFANLSVDKAAQGYALRAGSGFLIEATSSTFDVSPAAPAKLVIAQQPVNSTAGQSIGTPSVNLVDAFDNQTTSTASVTVALATNPGSGTLAGTKTVNAVAGVATFTGLSVDKVGTGYTLRITSGALPAVTSAGFNVAPGAPAQLQFAQQPTAARAGDAIAPAVTVRILDAHGNLTSSTSTVTLALATNPGSATLSGTAAQAAVAGVATFGNLSLDKVGTGYALRASSGVLTEATSNGFNITPGSPAKLAFIAEPTSAVAGVVLNPSVRVVIQDSFGNTVTSSTRAVLVSINDNPGSAVLSGTRTVSAVAGIVTYSNLSLDKAATGYTLTATTPNTPVLAPAFSAAFAITPAAPAKLAFATQPTNVVAGSAISPAVRVNLLDAFDNLTSSTGSVTVALASNPGSSTLSGTATVNAVSGVATFGNLSLNKVGTGYTLAASSSGTTGATSTAFAVSPGAPAQLRYVSQPKNMVAGGELGMQVEVLDAFANRATNATLFVRVDFGNNPNGASFIGRIAEETVDGIATFNNTFLFTAGNGYTVVASTLNFSGSSITSNAFNVAPAAPNKVIFTTQPGNGTAEEALAAAPVVTMYDRYDNTATQFTGPVTLALQTNPSAATLSGTLTVNAVAGVASGFSVIVSKGGNGYTLRASGGLGIITAESNAFDVAAVLRLAYTNPTVGKVRLMRNDAQSTAATLVLDVVATENLTGYGLGFSLPVDGSRVQLAQAGLTPGAILNPGSNPVAARAALPTTGPLAGILTTVLSQKAFGSGAVTTNTAIPAGSVLYTVRLERKGASPGVVFDGTGALPVAFNGALRDNQGNDVVARAGFGIGRLELLPTP